MILRDILDFYIIDLHRPEHLKFFDTYYTKAVFIVFGRQVPFNGRIIIAKSKNRIRENTIRTPFAGHNLPEYQIYEFTLTKYITEFKVLL